MPKTNILIHLPRLRLEQDDPFHVGFGRLVKPTWESYDNLTLGAYSDWQKQFDLTDPVFLHLYDDFDLPFVKPGPAELDSMAEIKMSDQLWSYLPSVLGHRVINAAHDVFADVVWGAVMLAAPRAAPGQPRSSVTFVVPEEGNHVELHGEVHQGIRVQGQADQEYLLAPRIGGPRLTTDELLTADYLAVARDSVEHEALGPALRLLLATTGAALSPAERLVLAVSALEGLLLAEVRTGHQDTLAQRVSALLGGEAEPVARQLYRARSSAVHDGPDGATAGLADAEAAEQLLADVIVAAHGRGDSFDPENLAPGPGALRPRGGGSGYERMHPRDEWWSTTSTIGVNLASPEGQAVSWSPLIGLAYAGEGGRLGGLSAVLLPFTPTEILSMEHQDVRRELAQLGIETQSFAGLGVFAPLRPSVRTVDAGMLIDLLRPRDLAVVGLRLMGWRQFVDPELLGWYVYEGSARHRRETVFRQTVLMGLGSESEVLDDEGLAALGPAMTLLARYDAGPRSEEVERLFGLFRRAHDTKFTRPETRATLLFAVLEMLLGRFRPAGEKVQLEDLVQRLPVLAPTSASWFASSARQLRNDVAHGSWRSEDDSGSVLAPLHDVVAAALTELLRLWPSDGTAVLGPGRLLVDSLRART